MRSQCRFLSHTFLTSHTRPVVRAWQLIAYVGTMFVDSMLHFELYAGTDERNAMWYSIAIVATVAMGASWSMSCSRPSEAAAPRPHARRPRLRAACWRSWPRTRVSLPCRPRRRRSCRSPPRCRSWPPATRHGPDSGLRAAEVPAWIARARQEREALVHQILVGRRR